MLKLEIHSKKCYVKFICKVVNYFFESFVVTLYLGKAARGNQVRATYAWGGPYLKGGDGYYLCNFKRISSEHIRFNEATNTYEIVPPSPNYIEERASGQLYVSTDAVDMYAANDFGLYNTCGNVAEIIYEEGKAVGGSWNDTGYDVCVERMQGYTEAS